MQQPENSMGNRIFIRVIEGIVVAIVAVIGSTVATTKVLEERLGNIQHRVDRAERNVDQLYRDLYRPYGQPRNQNLHLTGEPPQ